MADYTGNVWPLAWRSVPADYNGTIGGSSWVSGGSKTVTYAQRVYSSGLNQWCYYVGTLNATPLSSATTPNWTGAITAYENLGTV